MLLFVNIGLGIYNFSFLQKRKRRISQRESKIQNEPIAYDSLSPDFTGTTFDRKKISLSQFKGNIIILRFSKFYYEDLPYLLYLEHVAKRFGDNGVKLIFINTLGKHDAKSINKIVTLSSPIIEDDGSISSLFNSQSEAVILIDKDFRIKFKNSPYENKLIYDQVIRWTFGEHPPSFSLSDNKLSNLIKYLNYRNIRSNEIENLGNIINGKRSVLNLFISTCMGCPEGKRMRLVKEISEKIGWQNVQIIILFSIGNSIEIVRDYSERIALYLPNFIIGVIDEASLPEEEYLKLYDFEIDPRLFIFDERGDIIFSEKLRDKIKMNVDYLLEKMR